MRVKAFILSVAGAVLLAACGQPGVYYEKTPEQVAAALKDAYLPTHVLGNGIKRSQVTQPDANTVVTTLIAADGSEAMRFVTTITAEGTGSRVLTAIEAPEGKHNQRAGEMMATEGYMMALMDGLAQEHVAAAIEGRPFDMTFGASPMAKGMLKNQPGLQEEIDRANASAMEMAREQQKWDSERRSGWDDSAGQAFGEPMVDPRGSL